MTNEELKIYKILTTMLAATNAFRGGIRHEEFIDRLAKSFGRLPQTDMTEKVAVECNKIAKAYKQGDHVKRNLGAFEKFRQEMYAFRAPLELKYVEDMLAEKSLAKLKVFLLNKSDGDLDACMETILSDYRANRTPENRKKWNKVLGIFNKKIVVIPEPPHKLSTDERKLIRAVVEGSFVLPGFDKNNVCLGCSEKYKKFAHRQNTQRYFQKDYDFSKRSNIDFLFSKSLNTNKIRERLHLAVMKRRVPPDVYAEFNLSDAIDVLYKEYVAGKSKKKHSPFLDFKDIHPECTDGLKAQARTMVQNNPELRKIVKNNVRRGEDTFMHHKFYVFDAGFFENIADFHDVRYLAMVVGKKNHKNIFHGVDIANDGYLERLVDTKDGKDGQSLFLCAGWRRNVYITDKSKKARMTYFDVAVEKGRER